MRGYYTVEVVERNSLYRTAAGRWEHPIVRTCGHHHTTVRAAARCLNAHLNDSPEGLLNGHWIGGMIVHHDERK